MPALIFSLILALTSPVQDASAFFNALLVRKRSTNICDVNNSRQVQYSSAFPSNAFVTTVTSNYFAPQSSGNLNVVTIGFWHGSNAVTSVTDTAGNTYVKALGPIRSTNGTIYIYYAKNIAAAAAGNLVTVNFDWSVPSPWVEMAEYNGLDLVNPLDGTASGSGSGTALSTGNLTTGNACDLIYSSVFSGSLVTAASPNFRARTNVWGNMTQDRVVSSTGTYTVTGTQSPTGEWVSGAVAFKKSIGFQALNSIRNIQWNATVTDVSATTHSTPFIHAQTAGNLNVVVVTWYSQTGTVSSISDTAGNTYTLASGPIRGTGITQYVYYAKNIAASSAGANTVSVTLSGSQQLQVSILEYTGLSTTSPLDKVASATGTSTNLNSGSVTTTYANELILGINKTANHGWESPRSGAGFRPVAFDAIQNSTFIQEKIVSSTGTYNSTATYDGSATWIAHIVTFH